MKRINVAWILLTVMSVAVSPALAQAGRPQGPKTRSACSLLTTDEVKGVAASESPRLIDEASGLNVAETDDFCVWRGKSSQDPLVQLVVKVPPGANAPLVFTVTGGDFFGGGPKPAAVSGLGNEALYRDFVKGRGGTVVVRKGTTVFSITGLLSKDVLVGLARLVAGRL
jgi:hypothetical protein